VGTAYTSATNTGATETIAFAPNNNGNTTVTVGGTKTTGDQLTITAYNPSLAAGPESLTYTVLSTDTLTTMATALTALINADTKYQSLGVTATSSVAIITIAVNGGAGRTITNDANGNMTSNGVNAYLWDAENRLIQVTYPGTGNNSQFTYDPFAGLVKIVETSAGSITSTKQFVRCGSQMCEERNASSVITKQFFGWGQTLSGTDYYYFRNHLGSVTDMFTSAGTVVAHYEYGMWGEPTQTVGTQSADFGYAGYYVHGPSGLNLTTYRAYSPALGRWINRDPIEEDGGVNLYAYVDNDPIDWIDPSGLLFRAPDPIPTPTPTPTPKDDGDDPPPPTPPASGKGKGPGDTPTCRQLCSDAFFRRRNRCWKKYQCGSRRDDCISNAWGKWQQCIDKCKKQGK
jgi:RHS repeat-associated protein